jgi:diguanylate cyclase (GGDEF)-like protein
MKWIAQLKELNAHSRIFIVTMLVVCALVVLFTSLIEKSIQSRTLTHLEDITKAKTAMVNMTIQRFGSTDLEFDIVTIQKTLQRVMREKSIDTTRLTLIDDDGTVIADSNVDYQTLILMDNHINRPEIRDAARDGFGVSKRYSSTLEYDLIYYANMINLVNGQTAFIRVAIPEATQMAVINKLRVLALGFFVVVVATLLGMRFMEKRNIALINAKHKRVLSKKAEEITYVYNELQTVTAMYSICKTVDEALGITQDFVAKCFPGTHLEVELGDDTGYDIHKDNCWAARRNSLHINYFPEGKSNCTHTWATQLARDYDYAKCFPIASDNIVLGRASLYFSQADFKLVTQKFSVPLEFLFNNLGITFTRLTISEQMREKAYTDPLTGIWNRRYFFEQIEEWVKAEKRFCLLLLDADHFKKVNDELGHDIGDLALKRMARTARECAKKDRDIVARVGGEEFAILLDCTELEQINTIYARVAKQLSTKPLPDGRIITLSAGASIYPSDSKDIDELYKCADTALYRAKRAGRKQLVHYAEHEVTSIELVR